MSKRRPAWFWNTAVLARLVWLLLAGVTRQRDPAAAVPSVGIDSAARPGAPGATTAKVARCPGNWQALFDAVPLAIWRAARTEHQNHGILFGTDANAAEWLSAVSPRIRKLLAIRHVTEIHPRLGGRPASLF